MLLTVGNSANSSPHAKKHLLVLMSFDQRNDRVLGLIAKPPALPLACRNAWLSRTNSDEEVCPSRAFAIPYRCQAERNFHAHPHYC